MKKGYIILITISAILLLGYSGVKFFFNQIEKKASAYVGDYIPDTAILDDGRYIGHVGFLNNRLEARVEFIIEDHRLVGCNFEELFGTPLAINKAITALVGLGAGAFLSSALGKVFFMALINKMRNLII